MDAPISPNALQDSLAHALRVAYRVHGVYPVAGGCVSSNWRVDGTPFPCFVKVGRGALPQFSAEAEALQQLARCAALRVPRVLAISPCAGLDLLALEWLDLQPAGDEAALGAALACLHQLTAEQYGWPTDNFIGSTPQINGWSSNWGDFVVDARLGPQLRRAAGRDGGSLDATFAPLAAPLRRRLNALAPTPALVHGDLWRGNVGFVAGQPALFDPAIHYGDAECDLAMAHLFGGFSPRCFAAYRSVHPEPEAAELRTLTYQLYHLLNHFNLFGGHYARTAQDHLARIRRVL